MLLKDFYKIISIKGCVDQKGSVEAVIKLNPHHEVFQGHFPDNPVTPGVCMMQIVKELSERVLGKKLFLTSASNVKFMAVINPNLHPVLKLQLDINELDTIVKVKNITWIDDIVALKLSNTYKTV